MLHPNALFHSGIYSYNNSALLWSLISDCYNVRFLVFHCPAVRDAVKRHFFMRSSSHFYFLFSIFLCAFAGAFSALFAQIENPSQTALQFGKGTSERFTLRANFNDSTFFLSHALVIPHSERVYLDSTQLTAGKDYVMLLSPARVVVNKKMLEKLIDKDSTILVYYNYFPFTFRDVYKHREVLIVKDTSNGKEIFATRQSQALTISNIFGSNLQKSGSIFRGFTIGSNQDLQLNSGFRLQMSGKLSNDIDVVAALTDENTPLQPEGNTQTLQEIDQVYVELRSTNYGATLGDFYFNMNGGEFAAISRKLQGAKGVGLFNAGKFSDSVVVSGASAKGKYFTNTFMGIDGVQGPYRLSGKNNERNIVVIAGTEKVYVDGNLMTRGDVNDYSIEYSTAEITFSSKRLITSASRIVVDFEYSDRFYARNFFAVQSKTEYSNNDVSLTASYIQEGDDPSTPIDITLSDSDKALLAKSGAQPAIRSGVMYAGVDSVTGIGRGQYAQVDTVIGDSVYRIYKFATGTPQALYNVAFSFVGNGNGDYHRQALGEYSFAGKGQGEYLPITILPAPQLQQLVDINTDARITKSLSVNGEYAFSNFNSNRFSALSNSANTGNAIKLSLSFQPADIQIGSLHAGSLQFSAMERYLDRSFSPVDRIDNVEFSRMWSIDSTVNLQPSSEEIREANLSYSPVKPLTVSGFLGTNDRGAQFSSQRRGGAIAFSADSLPSFNYGLTEISSQDKTQQTSSNWIQQSGGGSYTIGVFTPSVRFQAENRKIGTSTVDSLNDASFSYTSIAPKLEVHRLWGMDASAGYELRDDNAALNGTLHSQAQSFIQSYSWLLHEIQDFSSTVNVTIHDKVFQKAFTQMSPDIHTLLVRSQARYTPLRRSVDADVLYEVSRQRSAKLQRVFYKVPKGEGEYIWVDGNHNGIVDYTDENDFQLSRYDGEYNVTTIPTEQLFPIVGIKSSARLQLTPSRIFTDESSWFEKTLSQLSTETLFRVEEQSSDPDTKQLYLLNLKHFLNDETTILGAQTYQQDMYVFQNRRDFSMRFRFLQRRGLGQYNSGVEHSYNRERSTRIRFQLTKEIADQVDFVNKQDNVAATALSGRAREISGNLLSSDLSYRPVQNIEVGFTLQTSSSEDFYPVPPVTANFNSQGIRTVFSFEGAGQARLDFSREEITLENSAPTSVIPYELTDGRDIGKTFLWGASLDYRITGNIQSTLQYTGRTSKNGRIVHTGRAEVRAFF